MVDKKLIGRSDSSHRVLVTKLITLLNIQEQAFGSNM